MSVLRFEALEERQVLAALIVTSPADSGIGSLREAIALSNSTPGVLDQISFAIPQGGVQTIHLLSSLPHILDPVVIDGTTQPGFSGQPIIELNGQSAGNVSGLTLAAGNTTVRGLVINRFGSSGIDVTSNSNIIVGNYIGLNVAGNAGLGNGVYGINIHATSGNQIGGVLATDRNVVSGNGITGIYLNGAVGSAVEGNFVGTNAAGTVALGNGFDGIEIFNGSSNTIGGLAVGAGNVVSGNANVGVSISGPAATANVLQGNLIGTTATGQAALGNGFGGIFVEAPSNTVGGTVAAARNTISGNFGNGIALFGQQSIGNLVQGNFIGVTSNNSAPLGNTLGGVVVEAGASGNTIGGTTSAALNLIAFNLGGGVIVFSGTGNAILGNSIFANAGLGIDLGTEVDRVPVADGVTPNDSQDSDTGANELQNFPVLQGVFAHGTSTRFVGTLHSTPNTTFRMELFRNFGVEPSGHGEGTLFVHGTNVLTNANGDAVFDLTLPIALAPGEFISATATNPQNSTSEFSRTTRVVGPHFLVTGPGAGLDGTVRVFDEDTNVELRSFQPYGPLGLAIRVATADFNADGIADIVTAAGPGGGPHVRVLDGATGNQLTTPIGSFFAYAPHFTGGIYVAVGNVNADAIPDVITAADTGGGPHVRVFDGATGAEIHSFFAFNAAFTGGVRLAAADVDGDTRADIITAAGPGGGPHVRIFSGATGEQLASPIGSFFAYAPHITSGVYVSAGNFNGGPLDVVTGAGQGGGPHVRVFDGATGAQLASPIGSFFAYAPGFTGGVRVATVDANQDNVADVVTAAGPGGGPHVRVFDGVSGGEIYGFFPYSPSFTGGVFVAGSSRGVVGSPLELSGQVAIGNAEPIRSEQLASLVDGLLARLGVGLLPAEIRISDLPSGYLGSFNDGTITIDADGAGYGWFVDSTPLEDEEFLALSLEGLRATDPRAQGRADLLSVLAHELGHALGFDHVDESEQLDDWMAGQLPLGTRRMPSALLLE